MKNLFRKVEKHLAKSIFSIFCLLLMVFAPSCKGLNTKQSTHIKVKTDEHVRVEVGEFSVKKGETLGATALREKCKNFNFDDGYELAKICFGEDANGVAITDASPYTFKESSATIYICSQLKRGELSLTSLKLGETVIPQKSISEMMHAGKIGVETVKIEATYSPSTAKLSFKSEKDPQPDEAGNWQLNLGENILRITLKDETKKEEKVYTLKTERVDKPVLRKLTIGDDVRDGSEIGEKMTFAVLNSNEEAEVSWELEPKDAAFEWMPELKDGNKILLNKMSTSLTLKVGEGTNSTTYTIDVKKVSPISEVVGDLIISSGRYKGVYTRATPDQIKAILAGEKDVTIELCGTEAGFIFSSSKDWKTLKINGEDRSADVLHFPGVYESFIQSSIKLGAKGEITPMEIFVDCNEHGSTDKPQASFRFNLKRKDALIDIPIDTLIIKEQNQIDTKKESIFVDLQNKDAPQRWLGTEPTLVEMQCEYDIIKSIKIDGNDVGEIKEKKDKYGDTIYYIEHNVTGLAANRGKTVHIEVEPKDAQTYSTLHWYFYLIYNDAKTPLTYDFELNSKRKADFGKNFAEEIANDRNPSVEVKGTHCNIKLYTLQRMDSVTMNGNQCSVVTVEDNRGNKWDLVKGSVKLIKDSYTSVNIALTPHDAGAFKVTNIRFQAKGTAEAEKIEPVFESIGGDLNLSKTEFINKLTTGSPTHKVKGEKAEMEISLSPYEYEFLCNDGVYFGGEKMELKPNKEGRYVLKKTVDVTASSPVECKVEFKSKDGVSETVTWNFKVQGGGEAPTFPLKKVTTLIINGFGDYGKKFLIKDFQEKLLYGPVPEFKFDGNEVNFKIGEVFLGGALKEITFKVPGATPAEETVAMKKDLSDNVATHKVTGLTNTAGYDAEIVLTPRDITVFKPLKLKLKLVPTGKKAPPKLKYYVDDKRKQENFYEAIVVDGKKVKLKVETEEDQLAEVYIGKKKEKGKTANSDLAKVDVKELLKGEKKYWYAELEVSLAEGKDEVFIVRVCTKDKSKYESEVDAEFILNKK